MLLDDLRSQVDGLPESLSLTRFADVNVPRGERGAFTWLELVAMMTEPQHRVAWPDDPGPTARYPDRDDPEQQHKRRKLGLPMWSGAVFANNHRLKDNHEATHVWLLDYDNEPRASLTFFDAAWSHLCAWAAHTSTSHQLKGNAPRWRVALRLSRPMTSDEHDRLLRWLRGNPDRFGKVGEAEKHRAMFLPCEADGVPFEAGHGGEGGLDVDAIMNALVAADSQVLTFDEEPARPGSWGGGELDDSDLTARRLRAALDALCRRIGATVPGQGVHTELLRAGYTAGGNYAYHRAEAPYSREEAIAQMVAALPPKYSVTDGRRTLEDAFDEGMTRPLALVDRPNPNASSPSPRDMPPSPPVDFYDLSSQVDEPAPPGPEEQADRWVERMEQAHVGAVANRWVGQLYSDRGTLTMALPGGFFDEEEIDPDSWPDDLDLMPGGPEPSWGKFGRILGPHRPDRTAVFVGPTGGGKSAAAVQMAEAAARVRAETPNGWPVLYVSAEMSPGDLVARLLAMRARATREAVAKGSSRVVPYRDLRAGRAPQQALQAASDALAADCPALYLWAPGRLDKAGGSIARAARAVSRLHDDLPPVVFVDYVQRMAPSADNMRHVISALSDELRTLARVDGLYRGWPGAAVIALSTTARDNYKLLGTPQKLRDSWSNELDLVGVGKESGELEADATELVVMTSNQRAGAIRDAYAVLPKVRYGDGGAGELDFYAAAGVFSVKRTEQAEEIDTGSRRRRKR